MPSDDGLTDADLAAKKFGASQTVTDQIERYARLDRAGKSVPADEIAGLLRLVARRVDSELVVKIAGQDAGNQEVDRTVRLLKIGTTIPGRLGVGVKRRVATNAAMNLLGAVMTFPGGRPHVVSPRVPLGDVQAIKCLFDGSAAAEILHVAVGFSGALFHDECRTAGAGQCVWSVIMTEGN